jgi:hypothetical protein
MGISRSMLMNVNAPDLELPWTRDDRLVPHSQLGKLRAALLAVDGSTHRRHYCKRRDGIDRLYLRLIQRPRQRARTASEAWCEHRPADCLYELRKRHLREIRLPDGDRESRARARRYQVLSTRNDRMFIDPTTHLARIQHSVEVRKAMEFAIRPDGEPQASRKTPLALLVLSSDSQTRSEQA